MKFGYTINNKLMMNSNGKLLGVEVNDPYNPLGLPPNTMRVRTNDGQPPVNGNYDSAILVKGTTDVYDVYSSRFDWSNLLKDSTNVVEVLGANTQSTMYKVNNMNRLFNGCTSLTSVALFDTSNVLDMLTMFYNCTSLTTVPLFNTSRVSRMTGMFSGCSSLTTVPLFNTSNVTDMGTMFNKCTSLTTVPLFNTSNATNMSLMLSNCTSLTTVPLFNTSNVTDMSFMLHNCTKVESGALALYQQASSQATIPSHSYTFAHCGVDTETGSAELAQIPSDWK